MYKTSDGIEITRARGGWSYPPPLSSGKVDCTSNATWLEIKGDWYRWLGRNGVLLTHALSEAHLLTLEEFLEYLGDDLDLRFES